mgnify:CR=1 FL=1
MKTLKKQYEDLEIVSQRMEAQYKTMDHAYREEIKQIVKALDDKLKLIELAIGISHVGHIPYEDVYYSSRYLEGALLTYLKKMKIGEK